MNKPSNLPLAYFITIRAYGTWLHGDTRLSVTRKNNQYGTPKVKRNFSFEQKMKIKLKHPHMHFNQEKRNTIKNSLENTCTKLQWDIYALHVRSNHVHIVLQAKDKAEKVMRILKTSATNSLRQRHNMPTDRKVWSRHGSTKYLWTDQSIYNACAYTILEQGEKMAHIDNLN